MVRLHDLPTPSLVLDLDVLERNLRSMVGRAEALGVALRPHLKTHKCVEIADLQRRLGARGVTVSTLEEARLFAAHGHDDLTWAFPLVLGRLPETQALAERVTLRLVVDSEAAVSALVSQATPFHVWLKVDCGYHRAGVDPQGDDALDLARRLHTAPHLTFDGLLSHSGQAYHRAGVDILRAVAETERAILVACAERLRAAGVPVPAISVGSTPAMSAAASLDGVDEARPGNYVFYDYTQVVLGSCRSRDCAVTVLASVVSSPKGASHCVVDAGALSLSKDPGHPEAPHATMGEICTDDPDGGLKPYVRLVSVSQEHGIVNAPLDVGSRIRIVPNHSCLAVACFDSYVVARGDHVLDTWTIHRQR